MKRCPQNPIIRRSDILSEDPRLADVSSVFNPGATSFHDQILLLLRVQNRGRETFLVPATSSDGVKFRIWPDAITIAGLDLPGRRVFHVYDPRVTRVSDDYYVTLAIDTDQGCRIGLAHTVDFREFTFLGIPFDQDGRNAVLFPEKINGRYVMLYRPNRTTLDGGVTSGSEIELATSDDLKDWRVEGQVMKGRFHYWDELIGSGPPPIKTRRGWLHIYHGVATHFGASNIYQAGVVLLDLQDPRKVIARSRCNLLEPREMCELVGQVPNVVFPSGLVPAQVDAEGFVGENTELYIYYGAADTCVGLATATVRRLLEVCDEM